MDIVLVANSPGELSALVKPMAEEFSRNPAHRLILVLTPCQYLSGKEVDFARTIKPIKVIIDANQYKKWALFNQRPKLVKFADSGVVLYLGGDLAHAMLVAKKLKYPAFAYIQERVTWKNFYRRFFVPDQATYHRFANKLPKGKMKLAGSLMVDSVASLKKWEPEKNIVTFMPGSRRWEINYMTPFYKKVMELLRQEKPEIRFQLVSSPFVSAQPLPGVKLISFDEIDNSELVVTIPGTNTAKIAARGIPMLVVFPLNHPEVIPLEGLANIVGKLPLMGKPFKRVLANYVNNKTRFFALPNQKAGREIIPEMRGTIQPLGVALKIMLLLNDRERRQRMSHELLAVLGPAGAAKKIAEEIYASL